MRKPASPQNKIVILFENNVFIILQNAGTYIPDKDSENKKFLLLKHKYITHEIKKIKINTYPSKIEYHPYGYTGATLDNMLY